MPLTRSALSDALPVADRWVSVRRRQLRVPGVQVAVAHEGEVVLSSAHGWADEHQREPLSPRHLFRVASHSKSFTAVAVLQLVDAGRLRLDDAVGDHVPELPPAVAPIALRELLSHGSGLTRDGEDGDHWVLRQPFPSSLEGLLDDASAVLPRHERFKYSNVGYALLGGVVEAVTGRSYAEHVREAVVDRIGLRDTAPELDEARRDELATGWTALAYADARVPVEHISTGAFASATGFTSTATDLVRYATALCDGTLLPGHLQRLMQREEWEVEGADEHYGMGLEVLHLGGRRLVGHGGGYPGHITKTLVDPDDLLAVSALTSCVDGPAEELATGVVRLVDLAAGSGEEPSTAEERDSLDRFTGTFATLWGTTDVVRLGGRLHGLRLSQPDPTKGAVELEVEDATTLRMAGGGTGFASRGELMRYSFGPDGTVESVRGASGTTMLPAQAFAADLLAAGRVRAPR